MADQHAVCRLLSADSTDPMILHCDQYAAAAAAAAAAAGRLTTTQQNGTGLYCLTECLLMVPLLDTDSDCPQGRCASYIHTVAADDIQIFNI